MRIYGQSQLEQKELGELIQEPLVAHGYIVLGQRINLEDIQQVM